MIDMMDDDCRMLTRKMPDGVLQRPVKSVKKTKRLKKGCLRAFTVHPGWAWAIITGVKKQEWRTFLPHPSEGMCAIHVSKSYTRSQWKNEAAEIRKQWNVTLIPYEELVAEWCGKVVGVCNYAASESDLDGIEYGWQLSDVRKLKSRIQCKGALKLWTMDEALSKMVISQL